jgi:hypothetical protein
VLLSLWIVILLCIIAQWAAPRSREILQRGVEPLQQPFLKSLIRRKGMQCPADAELALLKNCDH